MNNTVIRADIYIRYDGVYLSAIFSDDKDTISRIKSWVFKELFVSDYDDWLKTHRRVLGGDVTREERLHKAELSVDSSYEFNTDCWLDIEREKLL